MTDLVVRRLLVDLAPPFARHWAGDAFTSAFFDALSMSFPVGEQFFIDSVKRGMAALPDERRAALADEVQAFVGQEATHRRIHALFNDHLARQGLVNRWAERATRRLQRMQPLHARHWMAATAATEHLTAVFAQWMLDRPQVLAGAEARLSTLWLWHASEELEHRSTAFDLYTALGGNLAWRRRFMRIVTFHFACDLLRQTLSNLARDGALRRWSTWRAGWALVAGRDGLLRNVAPAWRQYQRADFHPRQAADEAARRWLAAHRAAYSVVGASTAG